MHIFLLDSSNGLENCFFVKKKCSRWFHTTKVQQHGKTFFQRKKNIIEKCFSQNYVFVTQNSLVQFLLKWKLKENCFCIFYFKFSSINNNKRKSQNSKNNRKLDWKVVEKLFRWFCVLFCLIHNFLLCPFFRENFHANIHKKEKFHSKGKVWIFFSYEI